MIASVNPDERTRAEHLRLYGDALVEGATPSPRDEIEATMRYVCYVLADQPPSIGSIPPTLHHHDQSGHPAIRARSIRCDGHGGRT